MLKITPAKANCPELEYAITIVFQEFLGLEYQFVTQNETGSFSKIELPNGHYLILEDYFFTPLTQSLSYLSEEYIPNQVGFVSQVKNPFIQGKDLPILFGTSRLDITNKKIICGADIFATTFFMLTRWEEYVLPDRDIHGRFPAMASLAGKNSFLQRPVVNEYVEMLWKMLLHLGMDVPRKKRHFELLLTHDVDEALLWKNTMFFLKKLSGDLIKRHSIKEAGLSVKSFLQTRLEGKPDPYDSFGYLMGMAEKHGLQSHFFFLCGGKTKYDQFLPLHHPFLQKLLSNIQERGHVIGLHPSYDTIHNPNQFKEEKDSLERITGFPVRCGRQHFLRFEAPYTWQLWEDAGMTWDSTLYYAEQPGFRCGVCYPFPVFNFLTRKKLRLVELPLTAMEVSWTSYRKSAPDEMLAEMETLIETVRRYQGKYVLLWHNSGFELPEWKRYVQVYEHLLNKYSIS